MPCRTVLIVLSLFCWAWPSQAPAQVCDDSFFLTSQAEVDAFECSEVTGDLQIGPGSDITNLDALSSLTQVGGSLIVRNTDITNVDGLAAVTSVAADLIIQSNGDLAEVDGLSSLTTVGESVLILICSSLTNVDGLSSLVTIGRDLKATSCDALADVDGFSSLVSVGGDLRFVSCGITNVDGLAALTSVGAGSVSTGLFEISTCHNLNNLDGLTSLGFLGGGLFIESNAALTSCCGLFPLLNSGATGQPIIFQGNGSGCTQSEILQAGECIITPTLDQNWGHVKARYSDGLAN